MPFGPHIIDLLETSLVGCFNYHNRLDSFVLCAGLPQRRLTAARERAEQRNKASGRFTKAPKRFVVQELLQDLGSGSADDDRLVAAIITALCKGRFPDATPEGLVAVEGLKAGQIDERQEAAERREEHQRQRRETEKIQERAAAERAATRAQFREKFLQLHALQDSQQRGYALERFLNGFLDFEDLNARGSFKIVGEQIDGSFAWAAHTYLVEAKWVKERVGGSGFGSLMYKIEGKTADTRGLFISINGYSPEAITGLRMKGELRFACIDGTHLMRSLEPGRDLPKILAIIWRHASETGEAYLPVSSQVFLDRGG
jgi:hypothetical protein